MHRHLLIFANKVCRVPLPYLTIVVACALVTPVWSKDYSQSLQPVVTLKVALDGTRHDNSHTDCFDAPAGELIRQASVKGLVLIDRDTSSATCVPTFENYVELIPQIFEPQRVCLVSSVKSVGGVLNFGKRGEIQCTLAYSTNEGASGPGEAPPPKGADASGTIAMLPATLDLERRTRSLVTARVPLAALQFAIDKAIASQDNSLLPPGFSVKVMSSRFEDVTSGALKLAYYVDVDVSGLVGVRCEIKAQFAIPAADLKNLIVQDVGSTANCKHGGLIGQFADLPTRLSNAIRSAITGAVGQKLFSDTERFDSWSKDDPEWAELLLKAVIQGSYCDWRGAPALCLRLGWPNRREINEWEETLLARVPSKGGPIDVASAKARLDFFLQDAMANRRYEVGGSRYPVGREEDGRENDGDMAIFGGLLCRSGERVGCDLLRAVQSSDGRFWRSPRRINEADTNTHASFSGDQLKGVLHYLTVEGNAKALEAFLAYVRTKPTPVPDASVPLESGYSTCPNYYPNFTCLIAGGDWFVLKLLAARHGLNAALPLDLAAIESRYGFSYDGLVWESLMINNGYRLHLIANTAWLLRSLGESDPRLQQVIQILAAREPANPFFLYLLHGPDQNVQVQADKKCMNPKQRNTHSDWAWQRSEVDKAWERSMVWDCVFIYGLLTRDPIPPR